MVRLLKNIYYFSGLFIIFQTLFKKEVNNQANYFYET
mgnify:CR=1 FL=1